MNYLCIISVTHEGLTYRDESKNVVAIHFQECAENYRNYVLTSDEFNVKDPEEHMQETPNCVGWRDVTAKTQFIEFFSQPRVKIEFRSNWRTWDTRTKFLELQNKLCVMGWTTLDLS